MRAFFISIYYKGIMRKISIFNFVFSFVFFCSINSSHAMQYIEKAGGQVYNWGWNRWYEHFASEGDIFCALDRQLICYKEDKSEYVKFLFKLFVQRVEKDERYNIGIANLLKRAIDADHSESFEVMVQLLSEKKRIQDKKSLV